MDISVDYVIALGTACTRLSAVTLAQFAMDEWRGKFHERALEKSTNGQMKEFAPQESVHEDRSKEHQVTKKNFV